MPRFSLSPPDLQRLHRHALDRPHGGDVGLVGARRPHHVHHLGHGVHVRQVTGKAIKEASEGVAKILEATHASASGELNVTVTHNGSYTKVVITLRIGVTK